MNKFELHIHTAECDPYARVTAAELAEAYLKAGYSGIVVTDHYFKPMEQWFKDDLKSYEHDEIVKRYLKGFYAAKAAGEGLGLSVISGAEVQLPNTHNHYLIYGLDEDDFYQLPLLYSAKNLAELSQMLPNKAVIVQAHPFRNNMTVCNPELLFGIEVFNNGTEPIRNRLAKEFAAHYKKAPTSGSDCHGHQSIARGGIMTDAQIKTSAELVEVLKSGNYSIIEP